MVHHKHKPAALAVLTLERKRHDVVTLVREQIVDSHGGIGRPYLTESILVRLERAGEITRGERLAGEHFQSLFDVSGLHAIRASDPARVVVGSSGEHDISPRCEHARDRIAQALAAVGPTHSPARMVCWSVLGLGMSLREFETLEGWAPRRPLSREASKGALVGALGILEEFFA